MGNQAGILPLTGSVGTFSFYKMKDGSYKARQKTGPSKAKFAADPNFQRTRENCSEFGRAGKAGKALRFALRTRLETIPDSSMSNRLTKEMMKVVKADKTSPRGFRNVLDGEVELLLGFEFNSASALASILYPQFNTTIDRATGDLTVSIPAFDPATGIVAPLGTTHFQIFSIGASVDFTTSKATVATASTPTLPWIPSQVAAINQVNNVGANSTHPLFLVLGMSFYQEVGGKMNALKSDAYNAAAIVAVSGL